jgi:hypothetical protein
MKTARLLLIASLVLGLLLATASTVGMPHRKPPFKPSVGEYVGTVNHPSSMTMAVTGPVARIKGRCYVRVLLGTTAKCSDGSLVPAGIPISPEAKGKSFNLTQSAADARNGGTNTYKLSGKFTSTRVCTGSGSKTTSADPARPESKDCSTGNFTFSLHEKG